MQISTNASLTMAVGVGVGVAVVVVGALVVQIRSVWTLGSFLCLCQTGFIDVAERCIGK